MSDLCSETVDAEVVAAGEGERVKASTRPDGGVDEPAKVSSQREEGMEATAHMEKDSKTLSSQLIPSSAASSTSSGLTEVSAGPVDVKKLPETEDSEVTCSQSSINSLLEETPSVSTTTMNVSEENGLSMDESLTSTKSDQALSLSDDLQSVEMAEAAVPSLSDDVAGAEMAQAAAPGPSQAVQAYYLVKWITWKEKKTPIITQSENGPCPLLAIMNILFLRWKAKLPAQTEVVTIEDLMAHLGECVLSIKPREKAEGMELNFQQNMSDAMAVLPKLSTGLDVNVRFTGVTDFEYTPECIVFDLLDIPLYHGWLVDPQSPEMVSAVGKLSYNQLVEKIIEYKHSTDSSRVGEGLIAEQFLESTATQLSYHGLCELNTTAKEGELSVFFRNNHFSTMIKHKHVWLSNCQSNLKHITLLDPQGHLYLLVTDQGFLQEDGVVWESLHNVEGDCNFCDSDFRLCHPAQKTTTTSQTTPQQQQMQIDQDYLVAMSLQRDQGEAPGPLSDLELARQLQQEEYQQPQQQQQPQQPQASEQMRGQAASHHGGRRRGEKKDDTDCSIL